MAWRPLRPTARHVKFGRGYSNGHAPPVSGPDPFRILSCHWWFAPRSEASLVVGSDERTEDPARNMVVGEKEECHQTINTLPRLPKQNVPFILGGRHIALNVLVMI